MRVLVLLLLAVPAVPDGRIRPVDPEKPEVVTAHLYSGTSGVVLFFLEAPFEH